jgi:hypothetical protein
MVTEDNDFRERDTHVVTMAQGIIAQPREHTALLSEPGFLRLNGSTTYNTIEDLEGQGNNLKTHVSMNQAAIVRTKEHGKHSYTWLSNPQSWNKQAIWTYGVCQPARYLPPVVLGLLLNILDALSYGEYDTYPL